MISPKVDETAPDFTLEDQDGKKHSLKDYRGSWVIIYFYPKDNTMFCTKEACSFRDEMSSKDLNGAVILGINSDSQESHKDFRNKHNLNFPLLSDPNGDVIKLYKANGLLFTKRISYLITPEGKIAKIYKTVNSFTHAKDIAKDIKNLKLNSQS